MTAVTGRNTRVIGWYHSHPHITVLPSHVDVRTQAMYQLLDSGFIGLIFSCFSEDAFKVGRIQVIAFQSLDGKQSHIARPVSISPVHKSVILDVESSSSNDASTRKEEKLEDTGDSKIAGSKGKGRVGVNLHSDNVGGAFLDIDPMDVTEGVQEAMHQSHLDLSGAEYVRKEIPLQVVPASSLLKLASPLASFIDLQRVLYEEEKAAYNLAVSQSMRDGKVHPLTFIHHTSTYQASMCKLMEYCLTPAIEALEDRLRENEIRLATLTDEAKLLEAEASRGNEMISGSPHRGDGLRGSSAHGRGSVESMNARSPASPSTRSRKGS